MDQFSITWYIWWNVTIHDNTIPDVEGGMYPAVIIQHFALNPTARLTIDGVPEILFGHAYDARSQEQAHCDSVV